MGAALHEVTVTLDAAPVLLSSAFDSVADFVVELVFEMVILEVEVGPVSLDEGAVYFAVVAVQMVVVAVDLVGVVAAVLEVVAVHLWAGSLHLVVVVVQQEV